MKRITAIALAALLLTALQAPALASDAQGPPCSDFGGSGDATYFGTESSATVSVTIGVPAGTCTRPDVAYTLHVLDASGTTQIASQTPAVGVGSTSVSFSIAFGAPTPSAVCIFVTSEITVTTPDGTRAVQTADRAPDTSCLPLVRGGAPPDVEWFN